MKADRHNRHAVQSHTVAWLDSKKNARLLLIVLVSVFCLIGIFLVAHANGTASTTWMEIYSPCDFGSIANLLAYLRDLRVPIPPMISTAEIVNCLLAGNVDFMTQTLYRVVLVAVYVLAMVFASSSPHKLLPSFLLSVVFLWSTVIVHPGNPQTYDIYFPLFVLLYILLLKFTCSGDYSEGLRVLFAVGSGFFLSMAELCRVFIFILIPILLFCTYLALKNLPRKYLWCFLIPVVVFTGGWHANLLLRHGQLVSSNHSGFNLIRAWPMVQMPALQPEPDDAPLKPGRWKNLNTAEHYENSRRVQHAVLQYILEHPTESIRHGFDRISSVLVDVPTSIYSYKPEHAIFLFYRPAVWISSVILFASLLWLIVSLARAKGHRWQSVFAAPEHILIILTVLSIILLSIGESGEEARFLISVLPLMAALPTYQNNSSAR